MDKQILIAVDGSRASDRALDYLGLIGGRLVKDLKVTVLYVMNPIPPFMRREAAHDTDTFRRVREMESKARKKAQEVLDLARKRLLGHGMPEDFIETKAAVRTSDAARDILFEGEHGLYDALVLGRRGLSKTQELFIGSTTNTIVQHAERLPVWVVGGEVKSARVLCAVDGSEGALRAVDHVGYMLAGNPEVTVTLFHVGASLANYCPLDFNQDPDQEIEGDLMRSDRECMDDFYVRALRVLEDQGFPRGQVETQTKSGVMGITKAILDEVKAGGYGTIVLGRRGENRSFFLGHVSDKVLARAGEAAVWVVG
ncbi:MAG: universal stress protein [Deltaproteobacteria bacterium]|nr:universal stress protein [Deltaproteobacteria bacterium]